MTPLILRVKCPKCGSERKTASLKRAVCFKCGKNFIIFSKRESKSNIVKIIKGDGLLLSQNLYKLGIYGKKKES